MFRGEDGGNIIRGCVCIAWGSSHKVLGTDERIGRRLPNGSIFIFSVNCLDPLRSLDMVSEGTWKFEKPHLISPPSAVAFNDHTISSTEWGFLSNFFGHFMKIGTAGPCLACFCLVADCLFFFLVK